MRKGYFLLLLVCFFAIPAFAIPEHDNYIAQDDVLGDWMYTYYSSWTPGAAPTGGAENENFFIGRVRPLKRFTNEATQVIQDDQKTRRKNRGLLWWVPIGESDNGGWTSLPSYSFNSEAFSSWSYITTYGNWTQGFLRQPGTFADACHKNGVNTACVSAAAWAVGLSPTDLGHGQNYNALINGGYDKLMKLFRYYGIDGLGFNSEQEWNSLRSGMKTLLQNCHANKANYDGLGDRLHFDFYQLSDVLGGGGGGTDFSDFFPYANGFFLNYNWGAGNLQTSVNNAINKGGNSFDVYAGMDQQGRSSAPWPTLNNYDISVGIWGAHNKNMIWLGSTADGSSATAIQNCYLRKCEQFFTGGTQNPVNDIAITSELCTGNPGFFGVAKLVAAKSALSWQVNDYFPFISYMNLGVGKFFNNEGETTFDSEWYNIGMQDHLPTWRWWITTSYMGRTTAEVPSDTHAAFTYEDAWFGGSCLKLTFDNAVTGRNYRFIQMYKTQFPIATGETYKIRVRYKALKGKATMAFAMSAEGTETTAVNQNMGTMSATDWTVLEADLTAEMANKVIAQLGMRFNAVDAGTEILIGEVALVKQGITYNPVAPVIDAAKTKVLKTTHRGVDFKVIWDSPLAGAGEGGTTPEPTPEPEEQETAVRATTLSCTISGNSQKTDRKLASLLFTGSKGATLASGTIQTTTWRPALYYDLRNTKSLEVQRGETITTAPDFTGAWMMGYIYVDWNNDGDFADANEYVASPYNVRNGTYYTSDYGKPNNFTIPDNVALGTYTMRYTLDWNSQDGNDAVDEGVNYPCGRTATTASGNYTSANGGCMVDFELHVTAAGSGSGGGSSTVDADAWKSVYNDQVDTWYFEIWGQQEGGEELLLTTTTTWAGYVVEMPFDLNGTKRVRAGVRAVAPDGTTKSEIVWSNYMDASSLTILDNIVIDKPVIKPNENFTISFEDPNHATANWVITNSATGEVVATVNNGKLVEFNSGLSEVGSYDVTVNGVTTPGLIQISPEETGAMPEIYTLTSDKSQIKGGHLESATVSYTSRNADGTVSKGLRVEDPYAFVARINDPNNAAETEFAKRAPYTYCMWFKVNDLIHSTQGINLLYKTDYTCDWPQNNWGEFWCQIRPKGAGKIPSGTCVENELSFNVCGWSAHDNARTGMTNGEALQKGVWYHMAVALDDNGYETMWINGKQVAYSYDSYVHDDGCQSAYNTNSHAFNRKFTRLYVGASGVYKAGFNGIIDEVQCWTKVLSTDEVRTAMRGFAKGAAPADLQGYWTFDETIQKTIRDTVRTVFPNWGNGTSEAVGYYSTTPAVNSDGESSLSDLYEKFMGDQPAAGCPIIPGSYVVETTPTWRYVGGEASITDGGYTPTSGSANVSNGVEANPFRVYLKLENSWGASKEKYVDIIVPDWTVGLDNPVAPQNLMVYPNPFVERVSMLFPQDGEYTFVVMNLEGKCISTQSKMVQAGYPIEVQVNGEAGMYILQIRTKNDVLLQSVKIEKK